MGFEREMVATLIEVQERKGEPIVDVDQALNLLFKGPNGYTHDFYDPDKKFVPHIRQELRVC